jgi:O-acetyl-ADP-ribose deacetylase (regulator of RNase III)
VKTFKYVILTALCAFILNACGDKSDGTSTALPSKETTGSSTVLPPEKPHADVTSASFSIPSGGSSSSKELEITRASLVYSKKHVIVNAANAALEAGGYLSGAIFGQAGAGLDAEIATAKAERKIGSSGTFLKTSEVFTTGAHKLSELGTQYIIHALGPDFRVSPYVGNYSKGYEDLRTTYRNVYAEMDRLNRKYKVTSIGIAPISAGEFRGDADSFNLFQIMIQETLEAMNKYPNIQPEFYLFKEDEYLTVKAILESTVTGMPKKLSSGIAMAATGMQLSLISQPLNQRFLGDRHIYGVQYNLNKVHLMGVNIQKPGQYIETVLVGLPWNDSVIGFEVEVSHRHNSLDYYAVKAKGLYNISSEFSVSGAVGYMCTNLDSYFPNNIRQLLNQFEIFSFQQSAAIAETCAQYRYEVTSGINFTTDIGFRVSWNNNPIISPFLQLSCNLDSGVKAAAFIAETEWGVHVGLNN